MFQDGKHFCHLVSEFMLLDRPSWFCNDLMIALFKTNWGDAREYIFYRGFVPFLIYFIGGFFYTEMIADSNIYQVQQGLDTVKMCAYGIPFGLGWLYFTYVEF